MEKKLLYGKFLMNVMTKEESYFKKAFSQKARQ